MEFARYLKLGILALVRATGGFAVARWLSSHQLRIICYHGGSIGDERLYNPRLFCTAAHVRARLAWLTRKSFTPMTLADAVMGLKKGHIAERLPVVVTIDDGWFSSRRDVIDPCLACGYPVALYVATKVAKYRTPVLDVTVNYILWRVGPRRVEICGLPALTSSSYDLANNETRRQVHDAVISWLRNLPQSPPVISTALEQFAMAIGLGADALDLQSRRFDYLDAEELTAIAKQGCSIELHGHEHSYPIGRPDLLREDIIACRDFLISIGLPRPRHYCYPSGEFDDHAESVFNDLDIASGTTCLPGLVDPGRVGSLVYLPRFLDGESITALEFEAEMSGFLAFARSLAKRPAKSPSR